MRTDTPDYQRRLDALDFSMLHDNRQRAHELETAQVILVNVPGVNKTTQVAIWLGNRGIKVATYPVALCELPPDLLLIESPLVLGLYSDFAGVLRLRQGDMFSFEKFKKLTPAMVQAIEAETVHIRNLCQEMRWPELDVTAHSTEEIGLAILSLLDERQKTN